MNTQEYEAARQYNTMTKTPVQRLIITLAIPTILSMMVTTIYNLVDTAFVGTLGTSASGAVGVVFGFMSIMQAFGFMFGQGSGSLLSRRLGEKNRHEAGLVASTGFAASFVSGILIAVFGFLFEDKKETVHEVLSQKIEPIIYEFSNKVKYIDELCDKRALKEQIRNICFQSTQRKPMVLINITHIRS